MDMRSIRRQRSREIWQARIMDCLESGQSVRAWCKEQGVGEGSYYYWLKQLRVESLLSQGGETQNALVPVFCEVPSAVTESCGMALSLRLPGLTLEVSQAADSQSIRMAQAVLSGLC